MKPIRIAADRWNFEYAGTGEFFTPLGGNMLNDQHPGQGTLFERFDAFRYDPQPEAPGHADDCRDDARVVARRGDLAHE